MNNQEILQNGQWNKGSMWRAIMTSAHMMSFSDLFQFSVSRRPSAVSTEPNRLKVVSPLEFLN